ncbi:MAG TPA: hypothetical protein VLA64_03110 [Azonexus sp.]|nr:hypothetical protein [Azonexus sp.]
MVNILRKTLAHPALAIGSTVLWGIIELVALSRAGRGNGGSGA